MKKTIQLVLAVLLGLTVFSVPVSAEEITDTAKASGITAAATGETLKTEGTLPEAIESEEAAAEQPEGASETDPETSLTEGETVTGENENEVPSQEASTVTEGAVEGSDETLDETPAESADETPDGIIDGEPDGSSDGILPSTETEPELESESEAEATPTDSAPADSEEADNSAEYVLSGKNIQLENGTYSYELVITPPDQLTFDNELENTYQGVDGKYSLHYEIEKSGNHIMEATGTFDNIMTESPLMKQYSDVISEDSYYYRLDLRTNEGFSFINTLRYLVKGELQGYSIYYNYNLSTNKQTFEVGDPLNEGEEPDTGSEGSGSIFAKLIEFFRLLFRNFSYIKQAAGETE